MEENVRWGALHGVIISSKMIFVVSFPVEECVRLGVVRERLGVGVPVESAGGFEGGGWVGRRPSSAVPRSVALFGTRGGRVVEG